MLKIGEYIFEESIYDIDQSSISLELIWTNSIDSLMQLFLNNNCEFELDGILYTEYNIISNISKNFENESNQCTITLKPTHLLKDAWNILLGQKADASYHEIILCRKNLEALIPYLPIEMLQNVSWIIPDCYCNTNYKAGDIVIESGQIRKCKEDCLNGEDFDEYNWLLIKDGQWVDYVEEIPEEEEE